MSAKNELLTRRFIVTDVQNDESGKESTEVVKKWEELPPAKQKMLAYAWNNAAMSEAGYTPTQHRAARQVV